MLRKIFGPKRNEIIGKLKMLKKYGVYDLYRSSIWGGA
jgi:hypothetical protein